MNDRIQAREIYNACKTHGEIIDLIQEAVESRATIAAQAAQIAQLREALEQEPSVIINIANEIIKETTAMSLPNRLRDNDIAVMRAFAHKLADKVLDYHAARALKGGE